MGKYIPGNPDLIVQNVRGRRLDDRGQSALQYRQAGRAYSRDDFLRALFRPVDGTSKKFNSIGRKFGWIGSPVRNFEVLTMRADTPYRSIEDIQKASQPPRCGTTGTGATGHYFPKFIEEVAGRENSNRIGLSRATGTSKSPSNAAKFTATRSLKKPFCASPAGPG